MITRNVWGDICVITGKKMGNNFENPAKWWLCRDDKSQILNMLSSAALWCIWKSRNEIYFQKKCWSSMQVVWRKILTTIQKWRLLCNCKDTQNTIAPDGSFTLALNGKTVERPRLRWTSVVEH